MSRKSGLKYGTMGLLGAFHEYEILIKRKRVFNTVGVGGRTKTNIPPFQLATCHPLPRVKEKKRNSCFKQKQQIRKKKKKEGCCRS